MNGLDKPGIHIYNNTSEFRPQFYSFPNDLDLIIETIDWIYKANSVWCYDISCSKTSR
jgi:hypothetical protein